MTPCQILSITMKTNLMSCGYHTFFGELLVINNNAWKISKTSINGHYVILIAIPSFFFLQEHIQEVLDKWTQIDDEIWAKIIVFERNRRVAKAYARVPVLTVNGTEDGFDGMR